MREETGRSHGDGSAPWSARRRRIRGGAVLLVVLASVAVFLRERAPALEDLQQVGDERVSPARDEVLIPRLGIRAPVVRSESWEDAEVRELLLRGVVLLPTEGWHDAQHRVITAHSSGAVSAGDLRFLFATIHRLAPGDKVHVTVDGVQEVYRVREQKVVAPTDIDALPSGPRPTVTLVSCWPLGSNTRRILVIAEEAS